MALLESKTRVSMRDVAMAAQSLGYYMFMLRYVRTGAVLAYHDSLNPVVTICLTPPSAYAAITILSRCRCRYCCAE